METPCYAINIVLVGDEFVGKTQICRFLVHGCYDNLVSPTIGAEYSTREIHSQYGLVRMGLWTVSGSQRYESLLKTYVGNQDVTLVVFDLNNRNSFQNVSKWLNLVSKTEPIVLIGNKCDLEPRVTAKEIEEFLSKNRHLNYYQVSGKYGSNLEYVFKKIVEEVIQVNPDNFSLDTIILDEQEISTNCCCGWFKKMKFLK